MWDLAKAYRQLARSPAHASVTIIASWHPQLKQTVFYRQLASAFGASVLAFNWAAVVLCLCLIQLL